ncbi:MULTISPECIES: NAD(P)H-binding protein [Glutamicibacter]|uniref:NAD(P)H-binding protein n=1 Tax=Glutamicibacter TaxID=1742989 RepID=UPI001484E35A|nr:NAD(P)H-binding protein [Glutamicibacter sp. V16R2B1]
MKVLLISCGDVGTEAGFRFQARGAHVTAWRRNPQKLPPTFHGQQVDVASGQLPPIDPDTEVALFTPVPASRDAAGYEHSYLQAARHLVTALQQQAPALRRLFYISSTAVNAGNDGQWVTEQHPKEPRRETAKVLACTEDYLLDSALPVTILRASGIYGPGRTRLIDSLREGKARLPRSSQWTNRVHRDDLAKAVVHLAHFGSDIDELYLATDNEPAQLAEVYEHLAGLLGTTPPPASEEAPGSGADRRLSNARLRATGWEPTFPNYREGYRAILRGSGRRHH